MIERHTAIIIASLSFFVTAGCDQKGACEGGNVAVEISGNHGHVVNIPADAIGRGIGGVYPLKGAGHEHVINLSDAEFATLNEGQPVTTRATSVNGHTHEIRVSCKK